MKKRFLPKNVADHTERRNPSKSSERKRPIGKIVERFENLYGALGCRFEYRESKIVQMSERPSSSEKCKKVKTCSSGCLSMEELERKKSPINPYNRAEYPPVQWLPPDVEDTDTSIPCPERETFPMPHIHTVFCPPKDLQKKENGYISATRAKEDCREELARKEQYRKIRDKVEKAVKKHKVFLIRGELPKLKKALEDRGWVQKYESTQTRSLPYGSVTYLEAKSLGDIRLSDGMLNERALMFTMLRHKAPDLIWDCRNDFVDWDCNLKSNTVLNRYQKPAAYTSKLGMANLLQESHWLYELDVADVNCPRSYNLTRELSAFIKDFRLTAAAGLLKWLVESARDGAVDKDRDTFPVDIGQVEFALRRCEECVADAKHESIDQPDPEVSEEEWNRFCDDHNRVLHKENEIPDCRSTPSRLQKAYEAAVTVLEEIKEIDSQYFLNGKRNVWIMKPSHLCCGSGISISHDLKEILRRAETRPKEYFIVQKYIEHPLLVQGTKFDIRLWYLVTCTFPLTIWVFRSMGYKGEPYYDTIYPRMAQAIVMTMLAAQESMDKRRCSFELYGADFMVMEDLSVWLIEINTNPRMHPPSSKISQRLYGSVLDSLVKVIMDLPINPSSDTGGFVLTYMQTVPEFRPYLGPCFFAIGKSMTLHEQPRKKRQERKANICSPWSKQNRAWTAPPTVARLRDPKVVDFIDYLNSAGCAAVN
ncbi:protein monoglycylase TTLL8-like isoform X2 [Belonocnema kinseyi]|uniref:protein monoglycylase TTLL8-like isoform X2 n=1 Tax=Belonocnema kinseyi TaxID=2817044 RepID=UPI00143D364D|nr:protein monoglycylase TTLL8-like isoform X2 [Belonocnema kinseyi]